jgi:hypothetical protein
MMVLVVMVVMVVVARWRYARIGYGGADADSPRVAQLTGELLLMSPPDPFESGAAPLRGGGTPGGTTLAALAAPIERGVLSAEDAEDDPSRFMGHDI